VRKRLQTEANNLMLVGHLSYLSRLVATLLALERDRTVIEFRMGGVVRLSRNQSGDWTLHWAIISDLLPALTAKQEAA
jgi:phosphohistidine phosphatase SixA